MSKLAYKTRGMLNPQGKSRVWFSCHPLDFKPFFQEITEDILDKHNCAIWYNEDTSVNEDIEVLSRDLSQMQLFVIPVTTRFLCTSNRARDFEFPFAIEHHIPILPLMQENGLDKLFNKTCGDLQFLNKNNRDPSAICFDEKLSRFLDAVLVGDELAEKVRAAFDAYIFLSYRKKDRKHAQDLMRLIHSNDFCRDIAIWYDEYLVPGENFNDSIEKAIQKSDLFAMVVTPNLINEMNYVMTKEYPIAAETGKAILPIEMVSTDHEALAEKYTDIPPCTDVYNHTALTDTLLDAVRKLAIRENDGSPEHNFFIGLAYLNGIDVEVDHARAVSLITSAAEAGVIEAIAKLVEMYRNGLGVERNYELGILWQEKKIALLDTIYQNQPIAENLDILFWSMMEVGDYYKELGNLSKAKETSETALHRIQMEIYRNLPSQSFNAFSDLKLIALFRQVIISYNNLGNILMSEGRFSDAEYFFREANNLNIPLDGSQEDSLNSMCYKNIGNVFMAEGDFFGAKEFFLNALEIDERINIETGTIETQRNLAISYNNLGRVLMAEKNLSKAEEFFQKALIITENIAAETRAIKEKYDLLEIYSQLGYILIEKENPSNSKDHFQKALIIAENIATETGTIEATYELSVCYNQLGKVLTTEGKFLEAREFFQKAIAIAEHIATEIGTLKAKQHLSELYKQLGTILVADKKFSEAREFFQKALVVRLGIAKELETIEADTFIKKRMGLEVALQIWDDLNDQDSCPKFKQRQDAIKKPLSEG